eukprot:tig00020878_g14853.t1
MSGGYVREAPIYQRAPHHSKLGSLAAGTLGAAVGTVTGAVAGLGGGAKAGSDMYKEHERTAPGQVYGSGYQTGAPRSEYYAPGVSGPYQQQGSYPRGPQQVYPPQQRQQQQGGYYASSQSTSEQARYGYGAGSGRQGY